MPTYFILAIILCFAMIGIGCQTAATNTNTQPGNTTANTAEPKPGLPTASVGSLATPTDAYKTAHELRKKKDIAGLKQVMHEDAIEFLTMIGEGDKKSLDDMLKEMVDAPLAEKAEVRNEKINGNQAVLEYLDESGEWRTMDFEYVNGKWLLTIPKAENPGGKKPER